MSTTADAFVVKLVYATGTASPGRTHCLQDTMHRTFCGRYVDEGESFEGPAARVTCRPCRRAMTSAKDRVYLRTSAKATGKE